LILTSNPFLGLPSVLFLSCFLTNTHYTFFFSPLCDMSCSRHPEQVLKHLNIHIFLLPRSAVSS
jgi:hypothetical protein